MGQRDKMRQDETRHDMLGCRVRNLLPRKNIYFVRQLTIVLCRRRNFPWTARIINSRRRKHIRHCCMRFGHPSSAVEAAILWFPPPRPPLSSPCWYRRIARGIPRPRWDPSRSEPRPPTDTQNKQSGGKRESKVASLLVLPAVGFDDAIENMTSPSVSFRNIWQPVSFTIW